MPTILKFRRGTTTQNNAYTGAAGELSIDTSLNQIRVHDGSTAGGTTVGAGGEVVDDTTPQLGGSLDVNGNSITSSSSQNIVLDSAAQVHLDGNSTNSVALFHFGTRYGEFERDSQDFAIKSMLTNANIKLTPNGSGNVILDGLTFPNADGSADQVLKTDGSGTLSFTDVSGGTSWQAVKTSAFTAVAGEGYFIDTTSAAITMTLPASPSQGDEVSFIDYAGTADTNAITIARNGSNIAGSATDLTVSVERAANSLVYVDSTQGWLLTSK